MKINMTAYVIPGLGALCAISVVSIAMAMRAPLKIDAGEAAKSNRSVNIPGQLVLEESIPTMEEVVAKHLFVPERHATGQKSFPDLVVKGVYVGNERNAVFSLKSRPQANLRIWQGDEAAALGVVVDERDPRMPIVDFLNDWQIKKVDFDGVTLEHIFTGEIETYAVDYTPVKHVADNAASGYGQGALMQVTAKPAATAAAKKPAAAAQPPQRPAMGPADMAGRIGAAMQRMSPEQRKQVFQRMKTAMDGKAGAVVQRPAPGGSSSSSGKSGKKRR